MLRAKTIVSVWACFLVLCAVAVQGEAAPQETGRPLEAARLLALVAGNALPENIAALIESRGVAFQPSEEYERLLKQAGANAGMMKALQKARVSADGDAKGETQVWSHLSLAGKLIKE